MLTNPKTKEIVTDGDKNAGAEISLEVEIARAIKNLLILLIDKGDEIQKRAARDEKLSPNELVSVNINARAMTLYKRVNTLVKLKVEQQIIDEKNRQDTKRVFDSQQIIRALKVCCFRSLSLKNLRPLLVKGYFSKIMLACVSRGADYSRESKDDNKLITHDSKIEAVRLTIRDTFKSAIPKAQDIIKHEIAEKIQKMLTLFSQQRMEFDYTDFLAYFEEQNVDDLKFNAIGTSHFFTNPQMETVAQQIYNLCIESIRLECAENDRRMNIGPDDIAGILQPIFFDVLKKIKEQGTIDLTAPEFYTRLIDTVNKWEVSDAMSADSKTDDDIKKQQIRVTSCGYVQALFNRFPFDMKTLGDNVRMTREAFLQEQHRVISPLFRLCLKCNQKLQQFTCSSAKVKQELVELEGLINLLLNYNIPLKERLSLFKKVLKNDISNSLFSKPILSNGFQELLYNASVEIIANELSPPQMDDRKHKAFACQKS